MYEGKGYGIFKEDVAEVVSEALRPIREKYVDLLNNKDYLEKIYSMGAEKPKNKLEKLLEKFIKSWIYREKILIISYLYLINKF